MILMAPTRNDDSMMTPAQHPMHAVIAPLGPAPQPLSASDMMGMNPNVPAPMADSSPVVTRAMSPREQYEAKEGQRLMGDISKDQDPYGSASNRPGFLGKFLHGLNVATGGVNRRQFEEQNLGKELESIENENSRRGLEQAQTAETSERTREMPGKEQSEEGLQSAQIANLRGEEEARAHPPEEWKSVPSIIGPNGEPVEIETHSGQIRFGGVTGTQQIHAPKPDTPEQQYIDEYQRLHKGATVAEAERAYTADTQKPPQQMVLVPGANGNYTSQNIRPGSTVTPGAVTVTQEGSQQIPTAQMRNMGEMAATIQPQMDAVTQEVKNLAQSLGPAVGRWNQLMVNKGGTDYPEFAGLDTDLDLLASAIVRTHFGARGGQGYREQLRKEFGEAQSPEDLIDRIQHAEGWIKGYAAAGGAKTPESKTGNEEPTRPANVPESYKYDANGPQGAGWYKPKAVK